MNTILRSTLVVAGMAIATQAAAQITFYEDEDFGGRSFTARQAIGDFDRFGFNDSASSAVVARDRWEVCEDARFGGRCVVLRPGRYPSLAAMGLGDRASSVRTVGTNARIAESRYAPAPGTMYDSRQRDNERLYEANVTSVRAVVGPAQQRCWIEREQVVDNRGNDRAGANVPGALVGALIGGVLGHQVGGGRGQDLATAGGAVGGAVIGANVGRDRGGQEVRTQEVQRCANTPSASRAEYWDVTYSFRGQEHRIQMTSPPGTTVTVNGQGEPRA